MFQFYSFPCFSISGAKRLTLNSAVAFGLIINPCLVRAEQDSARLNLQAVAESNAQELGGVIANDHWTRIEFSTTFIDPIVVVEPLIANGDNLYIVGIRNTDTSGFEINLKSCNNSIDTPLQETINYSVIEHSQLPSTEQANTQLRQRFAWGECPA
jgi:hypothetical protein